MLPEFETHPLYSLPTRLQAQIDELDSARRDQLKSVTASTSSASLSRPIRIRYCASEKASEQLYFAFIDASEQKCARATIWLSHAAQRKHASTFAQPMSEESVGAYTWAHEEWLSVLEHFTARSSRAYTSASTAQECPRMPHLVVTRSARRPWRAIVSAIVSGAATGMAVLAIGVATVLSLNGLFPLAIGACFCSTVLGVASYATIRWGHRK